MFCRFAARLALATAAALLLSGCGQAPNLRTVLKANYPGYDQIAPAVAANESDPNLYYIPGAAVRLVLQEEASASQSALWGFTGDYCPPGYLLSALKPRKLADAKQHYDFELGWFPRAEANLKRAKADLPLDDGDFGFLRRVDISIRHVRAIPINSKVIQKLDSACVTEIVRLPGAKQIRSIVVGDVQIALIFKDEISPLIQVAVANKLSLNLGIRYSRIEAYEVVGQNVIFGMKLRQLYRLRAAKKAPVT